MIFPSEKNHLPQIPRSSLPRGEKPCPLSIRGDFSSSTFSLSSKRERKEMDMLRIGKRLKEN